MLQQYTLYESFRGDASTFEGPLTDCTVVGDRSIIQVYSAQITAAKLAPHNNSSYRCPPSQVEM